MVKHHLPNAYVYADDTKLYLVFKSETTQCQEDAMEAMEKCIKAVRAWMITDKLKLNERKTEFLIIGTRQQLKKVTTDQLLVGDMCVSPVSNVKDLGVWLDSHLEFDVPSGGEVGACSDDWTD